MANAQQWFCKIRATEYRFKYICNSNRLLYLGRINEKVTAKQTAVILFPVLRKALNVGCNSMTPEKAKTLGRRYSFASAIFIFVTFQVIYLISETRGDFANGILFYLDRQMNPFTILSFLIFFLSFILLGQRAGHRILILKVNPIKIAFLYGLLTTILMSTYYSIPFLNAIKTIKRGIYSQSELIQMTQTLLFVLMFMFLFFLMAWLLTTHRLRQERDKIDTV